MDNKEIGELIPRLVHYCWFGRSQKPADVQYYIATWKNFLPNYQFIEWNEDSFDIAHSIQYVREAYKKEKWAFVSDYVRLNALYLYGGIYLDTDVQVFRSFDPLLHNHAFFGFESRDYLCTAVMAACPQHWLIKSFLESYNERTFIRDDGSLDIENTNVVTLTNMMRGYGLALNGKAQQIEDIAIYPQNFFSANDFINIFGKYKKGTFAYHHYNASWANGAVKSGVKKRVRHYVLGIARNLVGTSTLYHLRHG